MKIHEIIYETASSGATASAGIATVSSGNFPIQRRTSNSPSDNALDQDNLFGGKKRKKKNGKTN
jgi:hypothetical protein